MVGMAVEMMVMSRAAMNKAMYKASRMKKTRREERSTAVDRSIVVVVLWIRYRSLRVWRRPVRGRHEWWSSERLRR